jgi:hypothetical protein
MISNESLTRQNSPHQLQKKIEKATITQKIPLSQKLQPQLGQSSAMIFSLPVPANQQCEKKLWSDHN